MWVVLGGDGQVGHCARDVLTEQGIEHACLGRLDADITNVAQLKSVLADLNPRVIVNAAAWTAVDDAEDHEQAALSVNGDGARNVAGVARDIDAFLVHLSTDYVFPGNVASAIAEDAPTAPTNAYGRTKLAGELGVRAAHPTAALVVRTAWLYSEFGRNFARTMVTKALAGQPVRVVNDQFGQPTYAADLVRHIIDLVSHEVPAGVYHATNTGCATWYEFARRIFDLVGADTALVTGVPSTQYATRARRPAYSVLAHDRTRGAGVEPMRPWHDALVDAIPRITSTTPIEEV